MPLQYDTFKSWLWWFYWGSRGRDYTLDLLARPKHPDQICKQFLHVLSRLCRSFQEPATKVTGHGGAFFSGYFALVLLVAFITDEHEDRFLPLDLEHGLTEDLEALESCPRGDGVNENESLTFSGGRIGVKMRQVRGEEGLMKERVTHLTHWSRKVAYSSVCRQSLRGGLAEIMAARHTLTSGIYHFHEAHFVVDYELLSIRILYCWIIGL